MKINEQKRAKSIFAHHYKDFYVQYAGDLIFFARKFVDVNTAEDIVHDIFLKIWDKKSTIVVEKDIQSYLLSMVQNACYDFLKHQQVKNNYINRSMQKLKIEELKYHNSYLEDPLNDERIEAIYSSIEKLPDRCKDVFKMSYLEGRKHTDIAEKLKISVRTVDTHVYNALKTLRRVVLTLLLNLIFLQSF